MIVNAIILAAGQGTRMRSIYPKVIHPLAGRPMILHSIQAAEQVCTQKPVLVIGHHAEKVRQVVGERVQFAVQERQLGTADAVLAAENLAGGDEGLVVVIFGDMPLLTGDTLRALVKEQEHNSGPVTMTSVVFDDSHGFGRVIRDELGRVCGIVEEAVATPEQLKIKEVNVSAYCFRASWLWAALKRIGVSPKGEYYLTDIVEIAVRDGYEVKAIIIDDKEETLGINNRVHLAEAERVMRRRTNQHWMLAGVTMIDPETTYIDADAQIGQDTILYPNTYLMGATGVGEGCVIGPNTFLQDAVIGKGSTVQSSTITGIAIEEGSSIGPGEVLTDGRMPQSGRISGSVTKP